MADVENIEQDIGRYSLGKAAVGDEEKAEEYMACVVAGHWEEEPLAAHVGVLDGEGSWPETERRRLYGLKVTPLYRRRKVCLTLNPCHAEPGRLSFRTRITQVFQSILQPINWFARR